MTSNPTVVDADGWCALGVCLTGVIILVVGWAWAALVGRDVSDRGGHDPVGEADDLPENHDEVDLAHEEEPVAGSLGTSDAAGTAGTADAADAADAAGTADAADAADAAGTADAAGSSDAADAADAADASDAAGTEDAADASGTAGSSGAAGASAASAAGAAGAAVAAGSAGSSGAAGSAGAAVAPGSSTGRKPRYVWTEERQRAFLAAVESLPIAERKPKPIHEALERLGVQGLTRGIVKNRLYSSTPEVKEKKRARNATPAAKEKKRARESQPAYKEEAKKRRATPAAKEKKRARESQPAYKEEAKKRAKKRHATPAYKEMDKKRKATPAYKEKDKKRKATPAYKEMDKKRKATPAYKEKDKKRKATPAYKEKEKKKAKERREAAAAATREDFLAENPHLVGAVWSKDEAVAHALKAYEEKKFDEWGERTAQEAVKSHRFSMYPGFHGSVNPKTLRVEAFGSLSRNSGTRTWIGRNGREVTRRTTPAFKYPKGEEKVWGPHAAEAGKKTRPWLTMTEAEAAGFKFVPLAVFPSRLSALEGEYAVQLKAMEDLVESKFSGGVRGYRHMPAMSFRAPVPVDVEYELERAKKQLADNGKVSPATLYITYAEVGDVTAQAWAKGDAPDHIFVKETNMKLELNEC